MIRPFLKADSTAHLFRPIDADSDRKAEKRRCRKSKVQPSQRDRSKCNPKKKPGECYRVDSYRQAIERACKVACIPTWTPGRLRHNAATGFRKEFGLEVAQIMLGHQSAQVTQIYAERDEDRALAVVSKVG